MAAPVFCRLVKRSILFRGKSPYLPIDTPAYERSTAPHNMFLFLACETGLISLGALLSLIGMLLWRALRAPMTVEIATFTAILIGFLFIGCCDFYPILFQQGKLMFFLVAGLLASHVRAIPSPQGVAEGSTF